jgi:type II secretory pathway component PulF
MDKDLNDRLDQQDMALERIEQTVKQTRRIFLWMLIASVAVIVIPLIALIFVLPSFIDTFSGAMTELSAF